MIVWLDDERPMPNGFTHHVKTAWDAIKLLETGLVTDISLDHDLGTDHYEKPNNGYHVALWIEQAAFEGRLARIRLMVHTQNPEGRKNICAACQNAYKYWGNHE